jgi:integrase
MKAQKLPSGSWRVRIMIDGKSVSFTAETEDEAIYQAMAYKTGRQKQKEIKKAPTVGSCIDDYIKNKENILSPTTIEGYKKIKRNNLVELCDIPITKLTALDIQKQVNKLSLTKSAKTVINAHGFLVSVLNVYAPDLIIKTTLPKKQKIIKQLPDVKDVLRAIHGTEVELPCLLAVWSTLRMSEVRGLKKSDINNGSLVIKETIVTVKGKHIKKSQTKTTESTRLVRLPYYLQLLINQLPPEQEYLTLLSGQAIYKRFVRLLESRNIKHMSFHDLRHMDASIMLALGIPDKYAMERGGWSSPHIMKSVYQHTFSAERQAVDDKIDDYFNKILSEEFDMNFDTGFDMQR